jgi:hypothetical protein
MSRPEPLPIYLKIYDLHQSNSTLNRVGTGFYHTGVEVNGYEYSFSAGGVVRTTPTLPEFGPLRERMEMGSFTEGMAGINRIISELRNAGGFQPGAYDVIHLNCNHFSEAFCMSTVHAHIPVWCNRMAQMGSNFSGPTAAAPSGEGMAALGVVKDPELRNLKAAASIAQPWPPLSNAASAAAPSYSIFDFFGWGSGTSSSSGGSAASSSSMATPTSTQQPVVAARPVKSDPSKKKELTEKQKELLARMKKT